jgi:hypothetical protein
MAGRGHVGVDPETRMDHEHMVIRTVGDCGSVFI